MRRVIGALAALGLLFLAGCGAQVSGPAKAVQTPAQARTKPHPAVQVAAAAAGPVHYRDQVVVLMYHGIAPKAHGDYITQQSFSGEIRTLQADGFHFVSLAKVASFLSGGSLPPNAVAITFDDGLESVYTYAYPVLEKAGVPFAAFLIVGRVGRVTGDLSWAQVQAMDASGLCTVGSHTLASHGTVQSSPDSTGPALTSRIYHTSTGVEETEAQYIERITEDLHRSREILQAETGQDVLWFAYPFGSYDPVVEQVLRQQGYRYAVLAEWGWGVTPHAEHFALPRINAGTPNSTPGNIASTVEYLASLTAKDPTAVPPASYVPSWR